MTSEYNQIINWLMDGDPSIKYQTAKDLLNEDNKVIEEYHKDIALSGWCKNLLDLQDKSNGTWGGGIYGPKWISTTYTMLDLKNFSIDPSIEAYQVAARLLLEKLPVDQRPKSDYPLDLCICGMLLNLSCYGKIEDPAIDDIIDTLIEYHMSDGAWNCALNHNPHHSSLHTTINILEGLLEYKINGYIYRIDEIHDLIDQAHEFILAHSLFKSDKTGEIIAKSFTMLSYPSRWKYDILRVMDYFRKAKIPYDNRMDDAIRLILKKRRKDGFWPVQQKYSGKVHFDYEKTGGASRINTLRVLRVLMYYDIKLIET